LTVCYGPNESERFWPLGETRPTQQQDSTQIRSRGASSGQGSATETARGLLAIVAVNRRSRAQEPRAASSRGSTGCNALRPARVPPGSNNSASHAPHPHRQQKQLRRGCVVRRLTAGRARRGVGVLAVVDASTTSDGVLGSSDVEQGAGAPPPSEASTSPPPPTKPAFWRRARRIVCTTIDRYADDEQGAYTRSPTTRPDSHEHAMLRSMTALQDRSAAIVERAHAELAGKRRRRVGTDRALGEVQARTTIAIVLRPATTIRSHLTLTRSRASPVELQAPGQQVRPSAPR